MAEKTNSLNSAEGQKKAILIYRNTKKNYGNGRNYFAIIYTPSRAKTIDMKLKFKLEDLKVLRCSPDLLKNVKIGQGQLRLITKRIFFYHIWGLSHFGLVT